MLNYTRIKVKGFIMNKIYNLFRKFLIITIILSVIAVFFGLLTLIYYYNKDTVSVDFKNVIPICTAIMLIICIATVIHFVTKIDNLYISKIKKSFGFCHFAAALSAALASALFLFDFFRFVQTPTSSSALRILRLVAFVPFILYLILGMIPKRFHKKRIQIPRKVKYIACIGALAWAILGLLMIYFWEGLPMNNLFKLTHLLFYVLLLLFLVFEIKFELLTPVPKLYVLFSLLLFIHTTIITGSIMFAKFFGFIEEVTISEFEIFLAFALGIYALSKMIAIPRTMKFVKEKGHTRRRHRRHHSHNDDSDSTSDESSSDVSSSEQVQVNENTNE